MARCATALEEGVDIKARRGVVGRRCQKALEDALLAGVKKRWKKE